jgi:oxygen-dependent protoporphyrinogen oxidase
MRRVAVLGAGVSGLAAALRLQDLRTERGLDIEIAVYERTTRAGGCIQTVEDSGYTMELGPDSVLIDKPAAQELLQRLGLLSEILPMRPEFRGARIVQRGRLRPLPADFRLFAPTSIPALLRSGIFSASGLARAAIEPLIPPRKSDEDESLAAFVTRRFGREVLDRLAQPLVGGIYSGDPARLSMQATLPQFSALERRYGSVIRGTILSRNTTTARTTSPQLAGVRGGLQRIVDTLAQHVSGTIRVSTEVTQLSRDGSGWSIAFADGTQERADAVICSIPAFAAARVLRGVDSQLADLLDGIRYNSIATVNLAYDAADASPLPRTQGFVVPFSEGRRITAATISTQKYAGRSPQNGVLLRAFIGGALQSHLVELPDAELAGIARAEFADLLGITAEPLFAVTRRWIRSLPEYGVGHLERVASIEQRASELTNLALAGCALYGVGIPDCAASGQAAAELVLDAWNAAKGG